ncbi:MAG: nodulation protein NfeD [Acidobacteriia bacterium]|nr:nodulation protein NfeD [Terriglobia bacterium]
MARIRGRITRRRRTARSCIVRLALRFLILLACTFSAALAEAAPRVLAVDIDSVVHPVTVEIVSRALDQAQQEHCELVLIRLNTPGGLMEAMRETIQKIVASPVPVVTYVTPSGGRAASAGFFLLEAGDMAAMAPGTNTGAAHPVLFGSEMDPIMKQKVENDAAASLRSLVGKRGRNSDLAQKAVLESKSFTEKEALDNHLIELIAISEPDLMRQLDGREITRFDGHKQVLHLGGFEMVQYEKNLRQRVLSAISDPNIALILLVLGALGIYAEFSSPGLIFPGVAGAILVLLGLSALSMLPINWLGATLLFLAFTFFVLEAKFASHGVLALGGTVAMILGAVILINSPLPEMRIRLSTAIAVTLPFALITVFLVSLVVRARTSKVVTGSEGMIGQIGVAIGDLTPGGRVFVRGEYWNAVATSPLKAGERARVTAVDHLNLTVEPFENQAGA